MKHDKKSFDKKYNKRKFEVLGRRVKGAYGNPGISKQKGQETRAQTLLKEFHSRKSASQFIDRRFGEFNQNMSTEEKMLKRFAKERVTVSRKNRKTLFNLEDGNELTHLGKNLDEIDEFSDMEEAQEAGLGSIDRQTVSFTHFGGFEDSVDPNKPKSKQAVMREVMMKSKFYKMQQQEINDQNEEIRSILDDNFGSVRSLLSFKDSGAKDEHSEDISEYDTAINELAYDKRATASDRLKTEEELAFEEKQKLEKQERHRLRRMRGEDSDTDDDSSHKNVSRSADSLQVDFQIDSPNDQDSEEESISESDESESASKPESESESESASEPENESESEFEQNERSDSPLPRKVEPVTEIMAKDDIPFVIPLPSNFTELSDLLVNIKDEYLAVVFERMKKTNHPSLNPDFKQQWEEFCSLLLDYIFHVLKSSGNTNRVQACLEMINSLQANYGAAIAKYFTAKLKTIRSLLKTARKIELDFLITFKLIVNLYSTSDFRHYVVTPCLLLLNYCLETFVPKTKTEILRGLYACSVYIDSQKESKRHSPEVLNYLLSLFSFLSNISDADFTFPSRKFGNEESDEIDFFIRKGELKDAFIQKRTLSLLSKYAELLKDNIAFPEIFDQVQTLLQDEDLKLKLSENSSRIKRERTPLQLLKKKPIPLPMYTPDYEMAYSLDRKHDNRDAENEMKKLKALVKKEKKGAIRELKKDAQFLAKEKVRIRKQKDAEYKKRINSVYNILETDQSEMKKKK